MASPLEGVRVVEVANWVAVPNATALMADLGADVIKIEPPGGDSYRHSVQYANDPTNYGFQTDNRGKRSIVVDMERPGGAELVRQFAASSDIFITNLLLHRQQKYGLQRSDICAINPRTVYALLTGWGTKGPFANRAGYDSTAFWAGSGITGITGEEDDHPVLFRPAAGDRTTGFALLGAVLSGLRMRDLTGVAPSVELSLQAIGMWTIAGDMSLLLGTGREPKRLSRDERINPLSNAMYRCSDGRWVQIAHPVPFPFAWPAFCRVVGRLEWAEQYDDITKLKAAAVQLGYDIQRIFDTHDSAYWATKLEEAGLLSAPLPTIPEVVRSEQVKEMGWITTLESPRFGTFPTLDTPFKLHGADVQARGPAPEVGEHSAELLSELGLSSDAVERLAVDGVLG